MHTIQAVLWTVLLTSSTVFSLPSRPLSPDQYEKRDVVSDGSSRSNYTTSLYLPSSTTSLSTTASSSTTSAASTETFVQDITSVPSALGIKPLTSSDIKFIFDELPEILSEESESSISRRASNWTGGSISGNSGPDTVEKWKRWDMDKWLAWYVGNAYIWDTQTPLNESKSFLADFWFSTGEEGQFHCGNLGDEGACVAKEPKDEGKLVSGMTYDTRLRAYVVRVAIANYRNGIRRSYKDMAFAGASSQTAIRDLRTVFMAPDPSPPGDIMDVILPALGALAIVFPAFAPVAAVVGGVAAIAKALNSRDEPAAEFSLGLEDVPKLETHDEEDVVSGIEDLIKKRADQYAGATETAIDLHKLGDRISELEAKQKKTTDLEAFGNQAKKVGDVVEKAAKVVAGFKALNPALPKATKGGWDTFDSQVLEVLSSFPKAVENAFEHNKNTWAPAQVSSTSDSSIVAEGMSIILAGGQWFGFSSSSTTITEINANLQTFYKKLILGQVLKQQGVYFTRQYFSSTTECNAALQKQSSFMNSDNAECVGSGTGAKTWQLRSVRRPMTNTESTTIDDTNLRMLVTTLDDWVVRVPDNSSQPLYKSYWQMFRKFQDNSGTYPNLLSSRLNNIEQGLTMGKIFTFAEQCQTAKGNPFSTAWPAASAFYPFMVVDGTSIGDGKTSTEPACLFNIPIFELDDDVSKDWCKEGIMHRGTQKWLITKLQPLYQIVYKNEQCDGFEETILGAESKLCGQDPILNMAAQGGSVVSRPGCDKHDKGFYYWSGYPKGYGD